MLNFLNANPAAPNPLPPAPASTAPFRWVPAATCFVRRQSLPIIGCTALGLVIGFGYLVAATPQFTAVSTMTIDTRRAHPEGGAPSAADWQTESAYVESQVELIRSPATLRGVVEQQHLDLDPQAGVVSMGPVGQLIAALRGLIPMLQPVSAPLDQSARAKAQAITKLGRMLDVWRVGATSVVEVRVTSPDRATSARLANAVTDAYMNQQLVAISETTRQASVWLRERLGTLRSQAVAADRAVQEYKARNNIVDVTTGGGIGLLTEQQLGELNTQVAAARARVAVAQARYERARENTVNGVTNGLVSDATPNGVMMRLRQQYADAVRRLADLMAREGPTHGAVVLQRAAVAELQRGIQTELARQTEIDRGDFEVAQGDLKVIQARLAEQVKIAAETNIERSELRSLQSSADTYRKIYESFLQRFTQAMQDESYPISNARVAAVALAPMIPSQPRTLIVLAVALMLGVMLGVALAVLRDAMDGTVRTMAQLRQATGLECLGTVPKTAALACGLTRQWRRATRGCAGDEKMLVPTAFRQAASDPDSRIAEAVHGVRAAAARHSARGRDIRVIGCVSALSDEGSSTFAANLAFALAADGQRTMLVDWNGGSPWLTEMLRPSARDGLQELATGQALLADVTGLDGSTGLRFLGQSRGALQGAAPGTASTRAVLGELRARYDVVVVNLPPLIKGGAALRLSDTLDAFVLVTRWGATAQTLLSEAMARTVVLDTLFLGAVLTHCDARRMRLYPAEPVALAPTRSAVLAEIAG